MKFFVISTVALIVAGGTWTWVAPNAESEAVRSPVSQDFDERIGLKSMLTNQSGLNFVNLVIGRNSDGLRAFRARIVEDNHARPVFGQARRTCDSAPDLAECWEIAILQIDGEMRDLGHQASVAVSEPKTSSQSGIAEDEIETSDIRRTLRAPSIAVTEFSATDDAEVQTASNATHLVARPIINARSGPGLSNHVLFKLTKGHRLALISEERGWGQFIVLDGDDPGTKVWASLNILEDLR